MTGAVFVDSSVWIDHLRGSVTSGTSALRALLDALDTGGGHGDPTEILVGDVVLLEVLRGVTVRKAVDCLIAAWCISRDVPLLHADRDFAPFANHCGLRIYGR